jgi:hypothetical protein
MTTEVIGKSLGLFKQTVPKVSPMAVLWNPDNVVYQGQILRETKIAAGALDVELQIFGACGPDEFDRTFAAIADARAVSLVVLPDPVFSAYTVCLAVKPVGEPDAGNRHVRFDERGWKTEQLA